MTSASHPLDLVDAVIVTYNSADHLDRSLGHLPDPPAAVVVDNASTDASISVAGRYGSMVIANPVNAGFAAAANLGAAKGSRPFLLLLNPDASIDPDGLARLVRVLQEDPRLAVVSPLLEGPDGEQRVAWPLPSTRSAWIEALLPRSGRRNGPKAHTQMPGFVVGACFLVRRTAFEEVGGFDTRFWLYGEEADLCGRLADAGWGIRVEPSALARHEGGASAEGIEGLVFEHFQRGPEHFVAKRAGGRAVVSLRLAELVGSALRMAPGSPGRRAYHRRRAGRLWRALREHPRSVSLDSPATKADGAGLVVCSLETWDDVWRRNQFFVRELLAADPNRRVLFVEPAWDVRHEWRHLSGRRRAPGLRPLEADGRIVRLEPRKLWPRVLGPFADRSLRRQILRAAADLGFEHPDLWINDPSHVGLVEATRWPSTYDVTDDWTRAGGPSRLRRRVERREAALLEQCGSVVVCSEDLAEGRRAARPDLVVIPNAVDVAHFTRPRTRPTDLPPSPVAVYVGSLHDDRLDIALVERLASSQPDLAVALVGPDSLSAASRTALRAHRNIHLLGPRPYDEVPGYLQHADVLVVPHVVSGFTESLDPIKAYECVAVGRPTVATPVAGFRDLGGAVVCAEPDAFPAAVRAAVREGSAWTAADGGQTVPSWATRTAAFAVCIAAARAREGARPLRVVYVDHCAQLSGGELALVRLIGAVRAQRGVEAHVLLGEDGPLVDRLRSVGAVVEVLPLDRRVGSVSRAQVTVRGPGVARAAALAKDVLALRRRLRQLRPDVVHTNSLKAALYGGVAGRGAGVPVVWHIRDRIAPDYLPGSAVRLVHLLARHVPTMVIVPSQSTRETVAPALGPGQPCHVIHDMVGALGDGTVSAWEAAAVPSRSGSFRAVMVGRLAPWKGQHVFLRAFALAFPTGPEEALIVGSAMFGEDEYMTELRGEVERLGIGDRVTFTGFVGDVSPLLVSADCVVHASVIAEPFGQVVVEAMLAGRPVIASDIGGPSEVVIDGVDGLLCPPDDPEALAARMARLASDPQLRADLGRAARLRARDFAPEVLGPQVTACYDEVLALRRVRSERRR